MIELEKLPKHLQTIKKEDWDKLFAFIPKLEGTTNFSELIIGEKHEDGSFDFPHIENSSLTSELINLIYKMDLAPVFDYMDWKEGEEMIRQQSFEKMDAVTVCKYFTVMLRKERFMEGFISSCMSQGIVLKLLKHLKQTI